MSYILEALKRADAERERGAVPGLHAHLTAIADIDDGPRRGSGTWRWITLGFLIGIAGLVAGWWFALGRGGAGVPMPPVAAPAAPVQSPAPPVTAAPAVAPRAVPPVATAQPAAPAAPPKVAAAPNKTPQTAGPGTTAATAAPPTTPPKATVATAPPAVPRTAAAPAPARAQAQPQSQPAAAAPPAPRVPHFRELPENIRNQIPQLAIGGAMYSDNRANRMLILNGQLLHEGDQPVPGLVLEQIRPKAAILNYNGTRYEINY